MRFFSPRKASITAALAAMSVLTACGDNVTVTNPPDQPVVISITPGNQAANIGDVLTFAVQITGGSTTTPPTLASCTSSNSSVASASVNAGACKVTALAAGNATITAAASTGQQASAGVSVTPQAAAITNLTLSPTASNLAPSQTVTITPNVTKGAAANTVVYTYTTSSTAIATLSAVGANGSVVVTAVAPGVATVTATAVGTGTGFTAATLTAASTINVGAFPSGITSLTVQPAALNIALGTTGQLTSSVSQPAGAPAATVTYVSSNTAIASVTGAGLVTAVAPGNANITVTAASTANATFAASSLVQLVPVNVAPPAVVSINAINQGPIVSSYDNSTNQEGLMVALNSQVSQTVDITNTRDQIEVLVNLTTNGQTVNAVKVYVADATGNNPRLAATQTFAAGAASNGVLDFKINTAEFAVNWATGAVDVNFQNGLHTIYASVLTTNSAGIQSESQNAQENSRQLNFTNLDSWAMLYTSPSRVAQGGAGSNANLNWWGGPAAAGQGTYIIAAVFYTPGRTFQTATTQMAQYGDNGAGAITAMNGILAANICGARTFTNTSTAPFSTVFGSTALPANGVSCAGYEQFPLVNGINPARDLPTIYAVIDNFNNPGPFVRKNGGYRTSSTVLQPIPLRLDYAVPTVSVPLTPQQASAEIGWVNAAFSFVVATLESDAGVGLPTPLGQTYTWTGCTTGNGGTAVAFDGLVKPIGAAGEIPECSNNFLGGSLFNGPYTVTATQADVLGNVGTGTSLQFGVDKTGPVVQLADEQTQASSPVASRMTAAVRINADSIFDQFTSTFATVVTTPSLVAATGVNSTNALFGVRYRDERAGFAQANHGTRSLTRWKPAASPVLSNVSVASEQIAAGTQVLNFDGVLGNQESIQDAGDPTFRRDSIPIFGNNGGTATTPGYYFYTITVIDRAGNATTRNRTAAIDLASPLITGVTIPSVLQGGVALKFDPTGTDDLEAVDGDLFLQYPTMAFGGDAVADPTVIANQNGRLRYRRNWFADWHAPWAGASRNTTVTLSDGLLSTPFGPGAFLSNNAPAAGLTLPIGFYQRIEIVKVDAVQQNQGPHGRPAITRMPAEPNLVAIPAHATWTTFDQFKTNLLGTYAFDLRAVTLNVGTAVNFPNNGMSNNQTIANESALTAALFPLNITQPTNVNFWGTRDVDPITTGTQNLWSWYCFSFASATLECRAETGTDVVNSPFSRVDYYRWNASANNNLKVAPFVAVNVAQPDAAANAGQWIYIGSVTPNVPVNPIIQDQGVTRFWRFTFTFAGFGVSNNNAFNTEGALATGNLIRAIGSDPSGNAISTLTFTLP